MNTPSYLRIFCSLVLMLLCQTGRAEMPDLQPIDFQVPPTISGPPGVQVSLAYVTTNRGDMPALNYWEDRIYLSTKPQFDSSAVLAYYGYHYSWLEELCAERSEILLSMPATNSGLYYLFLQVDAGENIAEYEESNNQISRSFTYTSAYPNLGIARLEVPAKVTGAAPPKASYSVTFTNMGAVGLRGTWVNRLYWSSDAVLDSGDVEVGNFYRGTSISAGGMLVSEGGITISALKTNGSGWIIIQADGWQDLPDSERGNNVAAAPFSFELVPPDLQPINLHLTNSTLLTAANPYANAWWNLTNSGPGNLSDRQLIYEMFLSTNASMANAVRLGEMALWGPLAEGQATEINSGFTLPATESGRYYLSVVVDPQNEVIETDENNNIVVIPLDLDIRKHELAIVPSFTQTNFTGAQNPHMEVVFSVTNSGPLDAYNVCSGVFFSNDPVLDGSDPLLNYSYNFVASHGCVTHTNVVRLPATASSVCWLIKVADIYNYLSELNETNNIQMLAADVTVLLPDLEPISLQAPAVYSGPEGGTFPLVCTVTNRAPALAIDRLDWMYTVYLSTNGLLDGQSLPLSVGWMSAPLNGFSEMAVTNTVTVPAGVNGDARLFVRVNSTGSVLELNTNNNVISSPLQMVITPPDLIPFVLSVPSVVSSGSYPKVDLIWGITNAGPGAALGWQIRQIYFSTNATLEPEWDLNVDSQWEDIAPVAGASQVYEQSVTVQITNSVSGYLLFVSDRSDSIREVNEANNTLAVPISFVITRPDLVALPIIFPNELTTSPYPRAFVVWGISNAGPGQVDAQWPPIRSTLHLSRNDHYDSWDKDLSSYYFDSVLAPGGVAWFTNEVQLYLTNSGNWHLVARVDTGGSFLEVTKLNNASSAPFSITINYPDLAAAPLDFPSDLAYTPNSKIGVTLGATNVGLGSIAPGWNDEIWISRRPVLDDKAVQLISSYVSQELAPGQGYAKVHQLTLPISESGTYYLLATAGKGLAWDADLTNNEVVKPLNIQITPADLQPVVFTGPAPSTVLPNPTLQFVAGVTNRGPGAACPNGSRVDALVFSRDAVLDASDELISSQHYFGEQQPAQSMVWATNSVTLPIKESGTYYFFWVADYTQTIPESNESNNVLMTTITLTVTHPDLAPVYFEIPSVLSAPPFPHVKLVYAVTNYGPGNASNQSWGHAIYRAKDPEAKIRLEGIGNDVPAVGVYWMTNVVRLPMSSSGSYDIVFEVNPYRTLFESDYANNTVTNHIVYTAVLPDLAPVRLTAPATWTLPEDRTITVSYGITNAGDGMVIPASSWLDVMYLSRDPIPSQDDLRCFDSYRYPIMEPHSTAWFSETVSLPSVPPGSYYLVLVVNAGQGLIESSVTNNVLALPITVRERKPDLVPQRLIAPAIITNPVSWLTFQWYVVNQGLGAIPGNARWCDYVFLSSASSPARLAWQTGPLLPGIGYWVTNTCQVVVTNDGDLNFVLRTSPDGYLFEANNANNTLSVPVKVRLSKPDLAVIDVEAPSSIMAYPYAPFEVRWGITNTGPGATRPDLTILTGVTYTGSEGGEVWDREDVQCQSLPPGGSAHFTNTLYLPPETTNKLKVVFVVDPESNEVELTRTNNQIEKIIPVTVRYPDLTVSIVSYPTNLIFSPRQPVEFVYAITNIGNGVAQFPNGDALYDTLSMSNVLGEIVDPVESSSLAALAPGEGLRRTNVVKMPTTISSGPAIARIVVNSEQAPQELNWRNNVLELPMQLERRPADLAVSLSIMETNATGSNPFLKFRWAVTNLGPGDFYPVDEEQIRFGLSSPPNSWFNVVLFDIPLNSSIPVGGEMNGTNTIALSQFGEGLRYLVMGIEGWGEVTDTNNTASAPFYLDNLPDLAITTFLAPRVLDGPPNQQVKLIIEVKNKGTGAVQPSWSYWTSLRSTYTDVYQTYQLVKNGLNPGESLWFTNLVKVSALVSESYRWQAWVSFSPDASTANNSLELPVQVNLSRPSQLRAASLTADAQATLTIPYAEIRWSAANDGDGPTAFDWVDSVYYSLDNQFSLDDTPVTTRTNLAGLASGATYSWQTFMALPSDAKSGAFLVLGVDRDRALWDEDVANNFIAVPLRIAPFGTGHTWMSEPRFVKGRFQATLHGAEGLSVVLQASTNLVDWESLRTVTFPNDAVDIEDTKSQGTSSRFYRLIPLSELD